MKIVKLLFIIISVVTTLASASLNQQVCAESVATYSIASWPEKGHGNHRALVHVASPADAVKVHIPWRRQDRDPQNKAILVFDSQTGSRILNILPANLTRESCDLVFQPATAPGDYEVYYLPYNPGTGNFDDAGTYFKPEQTADQAWLTRNTQLDSLPTANLLAIQARDEFDSFYPMEVCATASEIKTLAAKYPNSTYVVFPEDRKFPLRMFGDIPDRWVQNGPSNTFTGQAQPNEYYAFQLGVFGIRKPATNVKIQYSGLKSADGKIIPASAFNCINTGGRDWLGRKMNRTFTVPQGKVNAMWIGVDVPKTASGTYTGTVTIKPANAPASTVKLILTVSGPVLADKGDSQLWKMSRIRWLDSVKGTDENVIPPFKPLKVSNDTVSLLNRTVAFGPLGLPSAIVSNKLNVLASPMQLLIDTGNGITALKSSGKTQTLKHTDANYERVNTFSGTGFSGRMYSKTEFDGCINYEMSLKATKNIQLRDISMNMPITKSIAEYMTGMSYRGGFRPPVWTWTWSLERAENMVWLGNVDAGVQLKLTPDKDIWSTDLKESGLPDGWSNGGRGGCTIAERDGSILTRVYTGSRSLKAGQTLKFRFRLLVTPFKPVDGKHWDWRVGTNITHVHHGTMEHPYINYPFLTNDRLKYTIEQQKYPRIGKLSYPANGNIDPKRGAIHIWAQVDFDPSLSWNQGLVSFNTKNSDENFGVYWNVDNHGMRANIARQEAISKAWSWPIITQSTQSWQRGEKHVITLSWGDALETFIDGVKVTGASFPGTIIGSGEDGMIDLSGGFNIQAVKISKTPYTQGAPLSPTKDNDTLLLDTFKQVNGQSSTPEVGQGVGHLSGSTNVIAGDFGKKIEFKAEKPGGGGVNIYYTLGNMSNHMAEIWPLRTLRSELFSTGQTILYTDKEQVINSGGGGYPWLVEHLVDDYVPGWRQPLYWTGENDAALATKGISSLHNWYIEGMDWIMKNLGIDGLYLDGIGYDRETMKRMAKTMRRNSPNYRINYHNGNNFDWLGDFRVSSINATMEHLPFVTSLWFGEGFDYDRSPDYWLIEVSGLPFGVSGEMLNYQDGGNPWRGMLYGMSGRQNVTAPAMYEFWDAYGIQSTKMIGYWNHNCPVKTDNKDILATVYVKNGKTLISIGSWAKTKTDISLKINWKALGLDPSKATMKAPAIRAFQEETTFNINNKIPIEPGKGWLIVLE